MGIIKTTFSEFIQALQNSSIAGLNNLVRSQNWISRIFWIVVFAIGVYFTTESIQYVINDYLKYPVVIDIDVRRQNKLEFPGVTVCNLNRVNCYNLYKEIVKNGLLLDEQELPSSQLNYTQTLLTKLVSLFSFTGCENQICSALNKIIPIKRYAEKDNLTIQYLLGCCGQEERNCNHLSFILADKNISKEGLDTYAMLWKNTGCTEELACKYAYKVPGAEHPFFCDSESPAEAYGGETTSEDFVTENNFIQKLSRLPDDVINKIVHQFNEDKTGPFGPLKGFFKKCTFKGVSCLDLSYWREHFVQSHGVCFTFNSQFNLKDKNTSRYVTLTGKLSGLSIELFLNQEYYLLNKLSPRAGARLVIHPTDHFPSPDEEGFDIKPNTANSVGIRLESISRLPKPFTSNCTSHWNETAFDLSLLNQNNIGYFSVSCYRICIQITIIQRCGCYHYSLDTFYLNITKVNSLRESQLFPCSMINSPKNKDYGCFSQILDNFEYFEKECYCNPSCQESQFDVSLTSSTWPSDQYWMDLARSAGKMTTKTDDEEKIEFIRRNIQVNYAKIDIYYRSLSVKMITQTPKYTRESFLSAFGGALSFYLGAAVILFFEIFEILFTSLFNIFLLVIGQSPIK